MPSSLSSTPTSVQTLHTAQHFPPSLPAMCSPPSTTPVHENMKSAVIETWVSLSLVHMCCSPCIQACYLDVFANAVMEGVAGFGHAVSGAPCPCRITFANRQGGAYSGITGSSKAYNTCLLVVNLSHTKREQCQIQLLHMLLDSFGDSKTLLNVNASHNRHWIKLHFK